MDYPDTYIEPLNRGFFTPAIWLNEINRGAGIPATD